MRSFGFVDSRTSYILMQAFGGFERTNLKKRLYGKRTYRRVTVFARIGREKYVCGILLISILSLISGILVRGTDLKEQNKASEELKGGIEGVGKGIIFTEKFYLKHLPEALERDGSLEDLNVMEGEDVSILPDNELFTPDLNARTTTRYSLELEKEQKKDKDNKKKKMFEVHNFPQYDDELSYIDDEDDELNHDYMKTKGIGNGVVRKIKVDRKDDEKEPGEEEQERLLEYDTEEKKKLLKLRKKHGYKDIVFGPQVENLAMTDIFGETGRDSRDPSMRKYGLESHGIDDDIEDLEQAWGSVVFPSKFKEKKIWGFDKEGRPIYSEKNWIKKKLSGEVDGIDHDLALIGAGGKPGGRKIEYNFPQKYYGVDGFLDSLGICGIKTLLDKYKGYIDSLDKGRKVGYSDLGLSLNKHKVKKKKEPEIEKQDIDSNKRNLGQDKQTNWQLAYNIMEKEEADKLSRDLEGVEDLKGVIDVLNLRAPSAQRRDAEAVFKEYYTSNGKNHKNRNGSPDNVISLDVELAFPSLRQFKSDKRTLYGWREALFDQAIENLGKYDQRAKKYGMLREDDEIKGIPPTRIITNLSSEVLRRPVTHHTFSNPYKGIKNLFFRRLEKKYRQYVSEIVEIRSKDPIYNEMMNLANLYESRQEWLKRFESPWLFIPKGVVFSEVVKNQLELSDEEDYEKELLALELDAVPTRNIDIFMEQHLKGDVLFPDEGESQEKKEAMFRKIMKETAIYNEKQEYKLPHRAKRSKKTLPTKDLYSPVDAIKKKEELNKKISLTVKGRVVATPTEKQKIKILEKGAKKVIESKNDRGEIAKGVLNAILSGSNEEKQSHVQEKLTFGTKVRKNYNSKGEENLNNEHIYSDEGRGPRNIKPPFSTTAVSVVIPRQRTEFDRISRDSDKS
ncbi:hypothetical protein FG386_003054 [Cryptosporidium ryanae]|uniref:uncharacterized protein n=1 Tax=Cryptosporidium ryanae TaxID=515981 RepID=UPI00351A6809|nr:hypothetical protein FG386_003054 [Cryptosporidium ryanae]